MTRKFLTGVALAAGPLLWVSAGNADQIGISGAAGTMTFTTMAGGLLDFSTAGFLGAAPLATFQSPNGTVLSTGEASFGLTSGTAGPINGFGQFPIDPLTFRPAPGEFFSYDTGATDGLTGIVIWPAIKDNTMTPQFDVNAVLKITSVAATSSGAFKDDFQVGGTAQIAFTLSTPSLGISLATLAGRPVGTQETFAFATGVVVPTPEPASLTILGSALVGLGWLGRRRRKAV